MALILAVTGGTPGASLPTVDITADPIKLLLSEYWEMKASEKSGLSQTGKKGTVATWASDPTTNVKTNYTTFDGTKAIDMVKVPAASGPQSIIAVIRWASTSQVAQKGVAMNYRPTGATGGGLGTGPSGTPQKWGGQVGQANTPSAQNEFDLALNWHAVLLTFAANSNSQMTDLSTGQVGTTDVAGAAAARSYILGGQLSSMDVISPGGLTFDCAFFGMMDVVPTAAQIIQIKRFLNKSMSDRGLSLVLP